MGTKVVVTGAKGFIGHHLCRALSEGGFDVHGIDNLAGEIDREFPPEIAFHRADITDFEVLKKITHGATYIFHTAALPRVQYSIEHPSETHEVNITGTLNVLRAAQENKVKRVVYSASSSAYGDQDTMPLVETMMPSPKSPYGLQKLVGEQYCKVYSEVYRLETVSLRYFNVYGPGQSAKGAYALVIAKFLEQKDNCQPLTITGDGTQTRDFTHVNDVVQANLLAMSSSEVGQGDVINIGAGNNTSVNQIAELIGGEITYIEARLEPHDTLADNSKAQELLGWHPTVSIEQGIDDLKGRDDRYLL